jgi:hypothetical protein
MIGTVNPDLQLRRTAGTNLNGSDFLWLQVGKDSRRADRWPVRMRMVKINECEQASRNQEPNPGSL